MLTEPITEFRKVANEFAEAKHDLLVLRDAHGADTEVGHICSNIVQLMDAHRNEADHGAKAKQQAEMIRQSVALAKAISAAGDVQ